MPHSLSGVVEASVQGHHQERADQRFVSDSESPLFLQSPNEDEQNLLVEERVIMNNSKGNLHTVYTREQECSVFMNNS